MAATPRGDRGVSTGVPPRLAVLFNPVDLAVLVYFRIAFGLLMLWEVWRYWHYGWIQSELIAPELHFTYFGFDWVRPLPGDGLYWLFAGLGVAALGLTLGLCYCVSCCLFCVGFTYLFLLDATYYLNHFYLICLLSLILIVLPAHRAFSVDALLRPKLRSQTAAAWTVWLLRFQVGLPYVYGGIAKLNSDWLQGEPMGLMLAMRAEMSGPSLEFLTQRPVVLLFAYGGLLFDLLIVPALLWQRTRPFAYSVAVLFHLTNAFILQIGIFPWMMIAATLVFFAPDWPRRVFARRRPRGAPDQAICPGRWMRRLTVGLLSLYLGLQLLIPLRHFLYPGNVSWTEEGHDFSWHMKLRMKDAMLPEFFLVERTAETVRRIDGYDYLTPRQLKQMACHPEKLLQFTHFLAQKLRAGEFEDFEIHVRTAVSLNGRKPQPIVHPDIDLASQPRTLRPQSWILPLREPLPDEPWVWPEAPAIHRQL